MSRYWIVFIFISSFCLSQPLPDSTAKFHNGRTAFRYHYKTGDTLERVNYYKNGHIKDSAWFRIETLVGFRDETGQHKGLKDSIVLRNLIPFGIEKKYYKKGKLSSVIHYSSDTSPDRIYEYRKQGSVSACKEDPYGLRISFNKKGKITRYMDYNKKSYVIVPKEYRGISHLKINNFDRRIKHEKAVFASGNKTLKLKSGALVSLRLTSDTSLLRHCLVEGFSGDSVCISRFEYDLSASKNKLKYDTTFMLSLSEIRSIFYSKRNSRKAYRIATVLEVTGFDMVLAPLVAVPLFAGGAYLGNPFVLGTIVAGVPVFIYGKALLRKVPPEEYKMKEWKIKS